MPCWITVISVVSLLLAGLSCLVITAHILAGHRQAMGIMNLVWPITALWAGPFALWAYFRTGVLATREKTEAARSRGEEPPVRSRS